VRVDHHALRHNLDVVCQRRPHARVVAMVKGDAYGHGAVDVGRTLSADPRVVALGVAVVEEAALLRDAGIDGRIVVHAASCWMHRLDDLVDLQLEPVVSSVDDVVTLQALAARRDVVLDVHLALDTGMGREGVVVDDDGRWLAALQQAWTPASHLRLASVFTHYANADVHDDPHTQQQRDVFDNALRQMRQAGLRPTAVHTDNSAAILDDDEHAFADDVEVWVRPGVCLYGSDPRQTHPPGVLRQVMHWYAPVVAVKEVQAGTPISYGGRFVTARDSVVAVVRVGYADGYARRMTGRAEMLVDGQRVPVLGTICMDMVVIDVTDLVAAGREVTLMQQVVLLGGDTDAAISAEEMATWGDTISYEVTTSVSIRVPRVSDGL